LSIIIIQKFEDCYKIKISKTNANETIIENENCDIFPNQDSMKDVSLTEIMEENMTLQTSLQ
jgi:hypothetical protein